jgi:hypothetical protein
MGHNVYMLLVLDVLDDVHEVGIYSHYRENNVQFVQNRVEYLEISKANGDGNELFLFVLIYLRKYKKSY